MVVMAFAQSDDPLWLVGQIAVIAVIGVVIYFGYRVISNSGYRNKKLDDER